MALTGNTRDFLLIAFMLSIGSSCAFAAHSKPCLNSEEAAKLVNKEVCVDLHVYDVIELSNGTRFLDVCAPDTPDEKCSFTIISLEEDRADVGELKKYRDAEVHVRGIVQPMHGRKGIVVSHARQFNGGAPKFKPNPMLLHGFSGEQAKSPIADPNLRPHGGHRAFMNVRDQETMPGK